MSETDKAASCALAIMREWQWLRCDPDGNPFPPGISLSEAVNRLAMDGIDRPQYAILQLLCTGEVVAIGDLNWRKYDSVNHFSLEQTGIIIKPDKWQALAKAMDEEMVQKKQGNWASPTVNLSSLGMGDCATFKWEFAQSRFSTAMGSNDPDDILFGTPEEWLSVIEIEVWPRDHGQEMSDEAPEEAMSLPMISKGGRPAAKWWPDFAEELAVYLHDEGLPEGTWHEGQSTVIDAIFGRMVERGKREPGRGTVQPVVNAVLRRLRSAEN